MPFNQRKKGRAKKEKQKLGSINKDAIQKSRQLSTNVQNSKIRRNPKTSMPSLEELNEYYNISESDEESISDNTVERNQEVNSPETLFEFCENLVSNNNTCPTAYLNEGQLYKPDECITPDDKMISQRTAAILATKLLDMMSKVSDPNAPLDLSHPSEVPQKRHKRSNIPYIVDCQDHSHVIKKPTDSLCKSNDCGVDMTAFLSDVDDNFNRKRRHRTNKVNHSKSIFNAKSDEIAARLKEADEFGTNNNSPASCNYKPFSPEPCSSKDIATINKNDRMLCDSLKYSTANIRTKTVIVDEDSVDNTDTEEFIVPKPLYYNDDYYIVEQMQNKTNNSLNDFIIIDDTKDDNIINVKNKTEQRGDLKIISIQPEPEILTKESNRQNLENDDSANTVDLNTKVSVKSDVETLQTEPNSHNSIISKNVNKSNDTDQIICNPKAVKDEIVDVKLTCKSNLEKKSESFAEKKTIKRNCPICLIDLKKCVSVIACGHSICVKCIIASINTIGHKCPVCKIPFV